MTRIAPLVGHFHPGDVSVANGEVFVSDSQNGMVFRLPPSGTGDDGGSPARRRQERTGNALPHDGTRLLVADYSQGIGSEEFLP